MTITIRQSIAADADSIGDLAAEFHSYLHALGDHADFDWGAAKYLRAALERMRRSLGAKYADKLYFMWWPIQKNPSTQTG
ncbi:MAG: hypothetical protein ACREOO_06010 [bacterium]